MDTSQSKKTKSSTSPRKKQPTKETKDEVVRKDSKEVTREPPREGKAKSSRASKGRRKSVNLTGDSSGAKKIKQQDYRASIASPTELLKNDKTKPAGNDEAYAQFQEKFIKTQEKKQQQEEEDGAKNTKKTKSTQVKKERDHKERDHKEHKEREQKERDHKDHKEEKPPTKKKVRYSRQKLNESNTSDSGHDTENGESEPVRSTQISNVTKISTLPSEKQLEYVLNFLDKELITVDFLNELSLLLNVPSFRSQFLVQKGFEKLSVHLVKKAESSILIQILSLLSDIFHQDLRVFDYLFTESSEMVTTFIWLLVKLRKKDHMVTAKVYSLLATLPVIAKDRFSETEIHHMLISSLDLYNQKSFENRRFQHLIVTLEQTESPELKMSIMKLINTLIKMHENLEARMAMRLEFISQNIEEILVKIFDNSLPDLQEQITSFINSNTVDKIKYKQLHETIISPKWIDGEDLNGLAYSVASRWSSSAALRPVVCATLCNLLHIPNDDIYATEKWLFINKIVMYVSSMFKENFTTKEVKLEEIMTGIRDTDITLRKELEDAQVKIQKRDEQIMHLNTKLQKTIDHEADFNSQNQELSELLQKQANDHQQEIDSVKNNLMRVIAKLSETEKKLQSETDAFNKQQKTIEELQEKLKNVEKQYREKIADEKFLRIKVEEMEQFPPQPTSLLKKPTSPSVTVQVQTQTTIPKAVSNVHTTPPVVSKPEPTIAPTANSANNNNNNNPAEAFPNSTTDLSKEELRMFKAINRPSGGLGAPSRARSAMDTPRAAVKTNDKNASPKSVTPAPAPNKPQTDNTALPDWKKRQLEKEKEIAEKQEREQQRKQEMLQLAQTETVETTTTTTNFIPSPQMDLSTSDKEEQRLTRIIKTRQKI